MRNKSLILMTICAALSTGLSAQSIYPGQHAGKMKKVTTAPIQVESFDLKDVRLLPSRFRDNMMRDSVWICTEIPVSQSCLYFCQTCNKTVTFQLEYFASGRCVHERIG